MYKLKYSCFHKKIHFFIFICKYNLELKLNKTSNRNFSLQVILNLIFDAFMYE